jgi:membrane protease YdiL (CAAX protease family)
MVSIFSRQKPFAIWSRVLLILLSYLTVFLVVNAVGYLITGSLFPFLSDYAQLGIVQLLITSCTLLLVMLFVRYIDKIPFKTIGLQLKNHTCSIWLGLAIGAVLVILGFFSLLLLREIMIDSIYFNLQYLLISIFVYVFVAVGEEVVFRGYVLRNFMLVYNKHVSLCLSSLLFALLHSLNPYFSWFTFLQITLAGIVLGLAYYYTRNLWFPISFHFSWNFFQGTIFGFNVSGSDEYSLIVQHPEENNMLNGGMFGYEGSIFCTIILLATIILIELYFRKQQNNRMYYE